jgi:F-box domain
MTSIPVDILRLILEHVDKADLPATCLLNKDWCSCLQDILYCDIVVPITNGASLCRLLARSTHLSGRVCSFSAMFKYPKFDEALQNMTSLRNLTLDRSFSSILHVRTFRPKSCDDYFSHEGFYSKISKRSVTSNDHHIMGDQSDRILRIQGDVLTQFNSSYCRIF